MYILICLHGILQARTLERVAIPFSSCSQSLPASGSFQWVSSSHRVAKVLEWGAIAFSVKTWHKILLLSPFARLGSWDLSASWASLVAQMVKNLPAMQKTRVQSLVGKIPWRREWQPSPVFLPGEFHGQRSLAGYSPWSNQESDTPEQLTHFNLPHSSSVVKSEVN